MKYYTELRYQLMPYIYSLASKTHFEDYTIMRALVMDYSDDEKTYDIDDQFMFGPAFMACPVYEYKARDREVLLPGRHLVRFLQRQACARRNDNGRGCSLRAYAFVRESRFYRTTGKVIQSTKEEQKDLTVSVYAGADGSFTLYEDNGVTYDYEKGNYATIRLFMMMRGERSRSARGRAIIRHDPRASDHGTSHHAGEPRWQGRDNILPR